MRTLLAHSLLVVAVVFLAAGSAAVAAGVPAAIGKLSDYGAVFDRHGRDEVNAAIAEIASLLRIDVYILVSWENPYPDVDQFAAAVFSTWNLTSKQAVLAVFVRKGVDWSAGVVASSGVTAQLGGIATRLEERMADLVAHRRVEEAVRALFTELKSVPAAQRAAAQAKTRPPRGGASSGLPVGGLIGAAAGGVLVLAILIRWRICPRCAGLLRRASGGARATGRRNRVYLCRRCGYRRGR